VTPLPESRAAGLPDFPDLASLRADTPGCEQVVQQPGIRGGCRFQRRRHGAWIDIGGEEPLAFRARLAVLVAAVR
jgi:hypothetical protein